MTASRHVPHQGAQDSGAGDPSPSRPGPQGPDGSRPPVDASAARAGSPGEAGAPGAPPQDTELLTALLDGMDVALCAFDADGVVTHWNREAEKILGWAAEEAVGRPGLTGWAVREADADEIAEQLRSALAGGHRRVHEFALVTKDSRRVLVRAQSAAVRNSDGTPAGVYWAFSEVHTQIELERSIALAEALFDDAPWGVILVDADLRPVLVNAEAARRLRTGRDSLLGRPLAELLPTGIEDVETAVHHVLGEGTPQAATDVWVSLRGGGDRCCWRSVFLRLGSPFGEEPVPLGVAWLFQDITEDKQAEQQTSQLRFRTTQLRRASRAAAECEDPMEAASSYLEYALAGFADHALLDLAAGEGRLVRAAATPADAPDLCVRAASGGIPVPYGEGHPAFQAVERLGSVRSTAERAAASGTTDPASWAAARRWPKDTSHGLCTVLRSRGRTLGVLTFLRGASRRPFDRADAAYAEDVAVRVAAAVDLARQLS